VVDSLFEEHQALTSGRRGAAVRHEFPSREVVHEAVELLRTVLFPGYFGPSEFTGESLRYYIGATLDRVLHTLQQQIRRGLGTACESKDPHCSDCDERSHKIARAFLDTLPEVRKLLATDAQAAYEGDPAATSADEAIFCYPGMLAITNYRLAHQLRKLEVPLIPRMITEHAHSLTGIDIHPGARIGPSFFIDHGTGVVIGETCILGKNVRLYQGVTLGAKSFPLDEQGNPIKGIDRHPILEDDVIVYSNATILGRVTIGKGSSIGGNVWLTRSVPPGTSITQTPARSDTFSGGAGI
jgi:serine O-acetyltransferase